MPRFRRRATATWSARTPWHPRACVRRAVTLRVDYATAQGQVGLGLVRNLSLQGMYMESTSRHGTPEVTPGDLLTVAFVLPSGQPCKLQAVVIHGGRHGVGRAVSRGASAIAHQSLELLVRAGGRTVRGGWGPSPPGGYTCEKTSSHVQSWTRGVIERTPVVAPSRSRGRVPLPSQSLPKRSDLHGVCGGGGGGGGGGLVDVLLACPPQRMAL